MSGADIAFPHIGVHISSLSKGITIGGFTIAFYGIIIACGMLAGLLLVKYLAKKSGQSPELYMDFAIWAIIFSLLGARLYYVAFSWDYYKDHLTEIFNTRGGGMAIFGGVIVAVITAIVFCKKRKYSFALFADTAVPGLLIGQIIGRYGNFVNREAFGEYTDSFFAMRLKVSQVNPDNITDAMRSHMTTADGIQYIQVHPTFFYESMWNIGVLIVALIYWKHKKQDGQIILIYLIGYGIGRCLIEGLRTDQLQIGNTGIAVSQVLAGVIAVAGVVIWIVRARMQKRVSQPEN